MDKQTECLLNSNTLTPAPTVNVATPRFDSFTIILYTDTAGMATVYGRPGEALQRRGPLNREEVAICRPSANTRELAAKSDHVTSYVTEAYQTTFILQSYNTSVGLMHTHTHTQKSIKTTKTLNLTTSHSLLSHAH